MAIEHIGRIVVFNDTQANVEAASATLGEIVFGRNSATGDIGYSVDYGSTWTWIDASGGLSFVSANDTTRGYLNGKIIEGAGIDLTENNDGGDETLTVATSYEVLMADGEASATPLANDSDDDWLYGE